VPKKAILVVIDGLTPAAYEAAVESGEAPTLAALHAAGSYRRAVSTFPSLTPVCLSAMGPRARPPVDGVPPLVWGLPGERRLGE
jgi:predicted AlkP superfamily pyrophosphatase or phosphodiesterase